MDCECILDKWELYTSCTWLANLSRMNFKINENKNSSIKIITFYCDNSEKMDLNFDKQWEINLSTESEFTDTKVEKSKY